MSHTRMDADDKWIWVLLMRNYTANLQQCQNSNNPKYSEGACIFPCIVWWRHFFPVLLLRWHLLFTNEILIVEIKLLWNPPNLLDTAAVICCFNRFFSHPGQRQISPIYGGRAKCAIFIESTQMARSPKNFQNNTSSRASNWT